MNEPASRSQGSADRTLIIGAVLVAMAAALLPLTGRLPAIGAQVFVVVAAGLAVAGGFVLARGTRPALILLWLAAGALLVLGVLSIFSIGLLFIIAGLLLVSAITRMADQR